MQTSDSSVVTIKPTFLDGPFVWESYLEKKRTLQTASVHKFMEYRRADGMEVSIGFLVEIYV